MMGGENSLLRVIERGGMIVRRGERYEVYRSHDARRGVAGRLSQARVDALLAGGMLCPLQGEAERFTVRPEARLVEPGPDRALAAPRLPAGHGRKSGCLLQRVLDGETDPWRQEYLARAASRFLGDLERVNAGETVTMNWAFVPGGKGRRSQRVSGGFGHAGVAARRSLDAVEAQLGRADAAILKALLTGASGLGQIAVDFEMIPVRVPAVCLEVLWRLACAYDQGAPRQSGDTIE